jgi:hypothetical protein
MPVRFLFVNAVYAKGNQIHPKKSPRKSLNIEICRGDWIGLFYSNQGRKIFLIFLFRLDFRLTRYIVTQRAGTGACPYKSYPLD